MSRSEFDKHIFSLSKDPSSPTFTRNDIVDKISLLQSKNPLVDQENFTKKVNLVPLRYKSAEVSELILDIFCDSGPPHILHSDNGREFSNNLLLSILAKRWFMGNHDTQNLRAQSNELIVTSKMLCSE